MHPNGIRHVIGRDILVYCKVFVDARLLPGLSIVSMGRLAYTFCEAEEHQFAGIEQLFEPDRRKPGWATWKYLRNPDGVARVFVAKDNTDAVVGSLAHVPRRFTSAQTGPLSVLQVVDVFVRADLRQQAVFLGLLQYARQRIDGPRIGFPNGASGAFGAGLGWRALGPFETWEFPVLVGQLLVQRNLAAVASAGDVLSKIYTSTLLPSDRGIEMKRIARFDGDYALNPTLIHGVRSADYLNWRFVDNPVTVYHAYEFLEHDEPIGYCVYARARASVVLSDFVTTRSRRSCLRLLVDHCREIAADRIQFSGTGVKLTDLGFLRRNGRGGCLGFHVPDVPWLLTSCDIDSEPE